ncbi:DUF1871 family protein [Bacillus sp. REN10]|uniref:DUF1871 family protein n=1 Tax=Bacillus sp. REN10 TaxID=2782541 RepID=UPI00193C1BB1|nr:DUF1871 family protein [Bacillus sp. REN10]
MDKTMKLNIELGTILREWDPFAVGSDFYDTESADAIYAVHQLDDVDQLAARLKEIYEFSFDSELALEYCRPVAMQLLQVKHHSVCELS